MLNQHPASSLFTSPFRLLLVFFAVMPYLSARSRYSRKCTSRKAALPLSSLFLTSTILLLALVYYVFTPSQPSAYKIGRIASSSDKGPAALLTATRSGSSYGDLCSKDNIFKYPASLAFLIPGVIFFFVGLAIVTDDYFVVALEQICERLNLSEDVAGATFMAAGSSTPEFFASLLGVFVTKDEVGIGTIVGSAVFNLLVIIGLSAALAGSVLKLDWRPLSRDSFFYVLSIGLLFLFTMGPTSESKGRIDWWEGLILVCTYFVYVLFMAFGNKPYMAWAAKLSKSTNVRSGGDLEAGQISPTPSIDDSAARQSATENKSNVFNVSLDVPEPSYAKINPRSRLRAVQFAVIAAGRLASTSSSSSDMIPGEKLSDSKSAPTPPQLAPPSPKTFLGVELPTSKLGWATFPATFPWRVMFRFTIVDCSEEGRPSLWWLTFLLSIVWISGISYLMVEAARISGCLLKIPAPAMGLTVLAAGTSVPDALASISVARDGAGDMAVSNAIGSNVFDILLGLGLPWFLGSLILEKDNGKSAIVIPTSPISKVVVPIAILFAIMIVFIVILVAMKWEMRPLLGYLLFGLYGLFVTYTLLDVWVFKFGE